MILSRLASSKACDDVQCWLSICVAGSPFGDNELDDHMSVPILVAMIS